jgi:phosphatidylglycerol:prolipoprotein diacylglycerol transferase
LTAKIPNLRLPPYWYFIILFAVAGMVLYLIHLQTGYTPGRAAISINALNFDVYWYGILIVSGVALGSYVVAHLAEERAEQLLAATIPADLYQQPIASLSLPPEIITKLERQGVHTAGRLLLQWGFHPALLGLDSAATDTVRECLAELPGIEPVWLTDAPWRKWHPAHVWNGVAWCLILGVIGARLYHILTPSPSMAAAGITSPLDYFRNPQLLINLRAGGLGIYGGIAGGVIGLLIYTRRYQIPTMAWADLSAVGVALGQAVGRWGNFFNQELYGRPTTVPWAVTIDPVHRLPGYTEFSQFHPAFLYESLWNFLAFLVLLTLVRRYRHRLLTGDLMALYLIFYGIGRTLLETVRLDSRAVSLGSLELNLPVATLVSLVVAILMAFWIILRHRSNTSNQSRSVEVPVTSE